MTAPATSRRPVAAPRAGGEQHQCETEDGDADGDVDEKDPVPVERVGEHAPEEHADRAAAGGDEPEDAHRLRSLRRFREQGDDERERDRGDDRPADALHRARGDEEALRARQAAADRCDGEQRDPRQEHPPVPDDVAEPPTEEQEPAERQQVCVHDPRERLLGEAEVLPDRGKRHPDDRHVEHDHQVAQAEDDQREPASAGIGDGHRRNSSRGREAVSGVGRPGRPELIAAPEMSCEPYGGRSSDGHRCAAHARARRARPDRAERPARPLPPRLRASRDEPGRARALRRARRRPRRGHRRRARAAPARSVPSPVSCDPSQRLAGASRARGVHGPRGRPGYGSRAGRPNSGKTRSVSRKNVSSTIDPFSISSTWRAHGS